MFRSLACLKNDKNNINVANICHNRCHDSAKVEREASATQRMFVLFLSGALQSTTIHNNSNKQ